ncbi:synapse differentiation-inducing gene protein 1 [Denticeps clupeoides]|uniref:Transmembrane protein 91 n=1 Tax=Denticeps clupeoides TaxID=299321 RepID=A0AAY4DBY3_9TELE|nr:synapse differentiation-inducing gene protein 1-like [Denticeps clupeoides]XP_028818335.1 synapse differentiation-inducing gene protein 1-like [Denticeps clupeoides]
MEGLDELEHPLLLDSPKNPETTVGGGHGGIYMAHPTLPWKGYSDAMDIHHAQFLDPCSLPSTLESLYPPGPVWGPTDPVGLHSKDYLETTFVDLGPGSPLERKILSETRDVHSVSYSVEDEDDLLPDFEDTSSDDFSDTDSESNFPLMIPQDYLGLAFFSMLCCFWPLGIAAFYLSQKTNKASAQGDFQGASAASRQALWLSVLSIIFGIITYICAVAALISYLSGKPP